MRLSELAAKVNRIDAQSQHIKNKLEGLAVSAENINAKLYALLEIEKSQGGAE